MGYVVERCGGVECCGLRVSFRIRGEEVVQGGTRIGSQNMVGGRYSWMRASSGLQLSVR